MSRLCYHIYIYTYISILYDMILYDYILYYMILYILYIYIYIDINLRYIGCIYCIIFQRLIKKSIFYLLFSEMLLNKLCRCGIWGAVLKSFAFIHMNDTNMLNNLTFLHIMNWKWTAARFHFLANAFLEIHIYPAKCQQYPKVSSYYWGFQNRL